MKKIPLLIFFLICIVSGELLMAQHEHHQMGAIKPEKKDTIKETQHVHASMPTMSSAYSLSLPMNRNGSGTSWLPDASPVYAYMFHSKKWMYMVHGNVFLRYTSTDLGKAGNRGASQWDAPNWFMGMAQRPVGRNGLFHAGAMLSLDRLTMGGSGYPLLYQSGETWNGKPLVDRQHPHDLFAELSVGYTQRINKDVDVFAYFGYPGEPAISATTFMHRPSAMYNPDAPLGHHWQDATHITFGVITAGIRFKQFKIEGSSFTGREPDENRYDFDKARFDSWSGRLSFNPSASWALQLSHAFIKSPEALHPDQDIHRTTFSIIHSKRFDKNRMLNSSLIWGLNYVDASHKENSVLLESAYTMHKWAAYGRYEFVEKSSEELALDENTYGHDANFGIHAFTLGINRKLFEAAKTVFSVGAQATMNASPKKLQSIYGDLPISGQVYLRINPGMLR